MLALWVCATAASTCKDNILESEFSNAGCWRIFFLWRGYSISIPKLPTLNPGEFVQLHAANYTRLLQNRDDLPSGRKHNRGLMHTIANEFPLAWIAHNYAETPQFANLLLSYITEHVDVPSATTIRQMRLLEDGLRGSTLTW